MRYMIYSTGTVANVLLLHPLLLEFPAVGTSSGTFPPQGNNSAAEEPESSPLAKRVPNSGLGAQVRLPQRLYPPISRYHTQWEVSSAGAVGRYTLRAVGWLQSVQERRRVRGASTSRHPQPLTS